METLAVSIDPFFVLFMKKTMEKIKLIIPRQPFMVMTTDRYLKKAIYMYGISHFFQMEILENVESIPMYIPDCCIDLMFYCSKDKKHMGAEIIGSRLKPESIPIRAGYCYFGVRFMPGFVPPMFTPKMAQLFGNIIELPEVIYKDFRQSEIFGKDKFEDRINVFLKHYIPGFNEGRAKEGADRLVEYIVDKNISTGGTVLLKTLAEETGYSERYINRTFKESMGISPKKFARIIRFQSAIQGFEAGLNPTEIAYQLNYYDCAHMVKEFKEMCGMRPSELKALLMESSFYEKLTVL